MKPIEVIKKLKEEPSRNGKIKIIEEAFRDGCVDFFTGVDLAYNENYKYKFKSMPKIDTEELSKNDYGNSEDYTFTHFKNTFDKLLSNKIDEKAAKKEFLAGAEIANVFEWNEWYRKIALRNLECNISKTMVDNVLKRLNKTTDTTNKIENPKPKIIPSPPMSKAQALLQPKQTKTQSSICVVTTKATSQMLGVFKGEKYVEPELNGERLLSFIDRKNNKVVLKDIHGNEIENYPEIKKILSGLISMLPTSMLIDGEIINRSYSQLMGNINNDNYYYALYDFLPISEFEKGKSRQPLYRRHQQLLELLPALQTLSDGLIYIVPKLRINISNDGTGSLNHFKSEAKDAGYTHYIVKDPQSLYNIIEPVWIKVPL